MTVRRSTTSLFLITFSTLLLPTIAGCASAPGAASRRPDPAGEPPVVNNGLESLAGEPAGRQPTDPRALDADGMAAQFQRDVEAMTRLRNGERNGSTDQDALSGAREREIAWNAPDEVKTPLKEETKPASNTPTDVTSDASTDPTPGSSNHISALPTLESDLDNQPPDVRLRELMVSLSSQLYRDAAYADSPLPQYLLIASMSMVAPERALNPEALPDLNEREREILRAYQAFFTDIGKQLRETGDTELLVNAIDELRNAVREEPTLTIPKAALCWRVRGYGQYDEFNISSFLAQSGQQVIVYSEVDDFTSVQNTSGEWVTELSEELVIHNVRDGIPVWRQAPMSVPDISRNQRREFFISHIITLPKTLPVGAYSLKVRVRDEKSGAMAETTIPFTIVADASLAARIPE